MEKCLRIVKNTAQRRESLYLGGWSINDLGTPGRTTDMPHIILHKCNHLFLKCALWQNIKKVKPEKNIWKQLLSSLLDVYLFNHQIWLCMKSNFLLKSLLEATGTLCYNQLHTDKCFIHITQLKKKRSIYWLILNNWLNKSQWLLNDFKIFSYPTEVHFTYLGWVASNAVAESETPQMFTVSHGIQRPFHTSRR